MADSLTTKDTALVLVAKPYKQQWVEANRGIFSQVARQLKPPVTRQHVRDVYFGRRRNARVERIFARLRAPGFERSAA